MSDKSLSASEPTAPPEPRQDGPLDDTLGGSINSATKQDILQAFKGFGWDQSKGVRTVCTAFLDSAKVRDAVFQHLLGRAA